MTYDAQRRILLRVLAVVHHRACVLHTIDALPSDTKSNLSRIDRPSDINLNLRVVAVFVRVLSLFRQVSKYIKVEQRIRYCIFAALLLLQGKLRQFASSSATRWVETHNTTLRHRCRF